MTTNKEGQPKSDEQKKIDLYLRQKNMLEQFLERNAISKEQFEKSLGDLTQKMNMEKYRLSNDYEEGIDNEYL